MGTPHTGEARRQRTGRRGTPSQGCREAPSCWTRSGCSVTGGAPCLPRERGYKVISGDASYCGQGPTFIFLQGEVEVSCEPHRELTAFSPTDSQAASGTSGESGPPPLQEEFPCPLTAPAQAGCVPPFTSRLWAPGAFTYNHTIF